MKSHFCLLLIVVAFSLVSVVGAQDIQENIFGGVTLGYFKIADKDFKDIYDSDAGLSYGGMVGYKVRENIAVVGKLKFFSKSGSHTEVDEYDLFGTTYTDVYNYDSDWKERWFSLGGRYYFLTEELAPYAGAHLIFGKGTAEVGGEWESEEDGVLVDSGTFPSISVEESGTGFGIAGGVEYEVHPNVSVWGELEFTSVSLGGDLDVDAGGLFFGVGAVFHF